MDRLRIGLVGFGRFGKVHAEALSSIRDAEITCVCTQSEAGAYEARKALQVEVYRDYQEFLEKGSMDVVDIVTPNYLHAEQALKAMARGKHLFLEKPVATTIDDMRRLMEARSARSVQVGFEGRYTPLWKRLKGFLEDGTVSQPSFAKFESWRGPFRTGSDGWRYDGARVGHQLLEEAVHYFDLAAWYFGMPEKVSGFTDSPLTWSQGRFRTAVALLEYASGLKVMVADTINGASENVSVTISGEGAAIGVSYSEPEARSESAWVKVRDASKTDVRGERVEAVSELESVRIELRHFVESLRKGMDPAVTLEDGFNATALVLATIAAIQTGTSQAPARVKRL